MTKVKRVVKQRGEALPRKTITRRKVKTLSMTKNKPSQKLHDYPLIIHGIPGIGKTTLIGQFPDVYSFMFDPNDSYEMYMDTCEDWIDFKDLQLQFLKGKHNFKASHIDNGMVAYEYALDYACQKFDFDHPGGRDDYGASWNKVKKIFVPPMRKLMMSKYGFFVSCHSEEKVLQTISGKKYNTIAPQLPSQAYQFFVHQIPNIFYYHYVKNERWLQIIGDEHIVAKNRMKGHFLTTKGDPIYKIPMEGGEEQAYKNLLRAFNNKQKNSYRPTFTERKTSSFKKKTN